jgi:Flp pilus assembly protein TadG
MAIEFAIVAIPFLFLLFASIELSLIFVMNNSLSNAMSVAAQQIRLGNVIATGVSSTTSTGSQLDLSDFKRLVCSKIALVSSTACASQLQLDVRPLSGYQSMSPPSPSSGANFNTSSLCYYSGQAGSVVEITGYYLWPVLPLPFLSVLTQTTSLTTSSGSTSGSWFLLTYSEVFKTEPNAGIVNPGSGC